MISLHACATAQPDATPVSSADDVFRMLRNPTNAVRAQIAKVRREQDPKRRRALKAALPAVTWSGVFTAKGEDGFVTHSGLYVYDFDHVPSPRGFLYTLADSGLACIAGAWVSPSGDGVKVVLEGPIAGSPGEHRAAWTYGSRLLTNALGKEAAFSDAAAEVSRLCYLGDNSDPESIWTPSFYEAFTVTASTTEACGDGEGDDSGLSDDIPDGQRAMPNVDRAEVLDMLAVITADIDYRTWVKVIFAAASVLGHTDETKTTLETWCRTTGGARGVWGKDERRTWETLWKSVCADEGATKAGVGSLIKLAREAGWKNWKDLLRYQPLKDGSQKLMASEYNLGVVLRHHPQLRGRLWHDEIAGVDMLRPKAGGWVPEGGALSLQMAWSLCESLQDVDHVRVAAADGVYAGLSAVAQQHRVNARRAWLEGLRWDGIARLERLWVDGFGAQDTALARAAGATWMTGAAARTLWPGTDFQMVPVLVGPQGTGKSTGVAALCPDHGWFVDSPIDMRGGKATYEVLRRATIVELCEMASHRKADEDALKQFVSERHITYQRSYDRQATTIDASWVFVGTTNNEAFLTDTTGNRRYVTLHVTGRNGDYAQTQAWVAANRDQLWAEAVVRAKANGERKAVILPRAVWADAAKANEAAVVVDMMEELVEDMTRRMRATGARLSMVDAAAQVGMSGMEKRGEQYRLAGYLRKHGWKREHTREGKRWVLVGDAI